MRKIKSIIACLVTLLGRFGSFTIRHNHRPFGVVLMLTHSNWNHSKGHVGLSQKTISPALTCLHRAIYWLIRVVRIRLFQTFFNFWWAIRFLSVQPWVRSPGSRMIWFQKRPVREKNFGFLLPNLYNNKRNYSFS